MNGFPYGWRLVVTDAHCRAVTDFAVDVTCQPAPTRLGVARVGATPHTAQGLRGKKVEIYSLPYSAINMWSSENAGKLLDLNAELELWTRAGHIKVNLNKGIDIRRLDRLIADAVLGNLT
jgi:hypothetical protein